MAEQRIKLEEVYKRDALSFAIAHVDLLDGKKWEVGTRSWIIDIYKEMSLFDKEQGKEIPKKVALMKPTQIGMSTMGLAKMFHYALYRPMRIIYTLPRQQDLFDLVSTRVDPMIRNSPLLEAALQKPDSTRAKSIGESFIFFMELTVEPRMMPADTLFIDEVDLSNPEHLGTVLNRLDASDLGLIHYFGTPTIPRYGIDGLYAQTDKKEWMVQCEKCNTYQVMDWDKNLRVKGPTMKPKEVYFGCVRCDHPLELPQIQKGQWIANEPTLTKEFSGYHITQMMTHTAETMYKNFIDPQQTLTEFYRKRLGKPYEIAGGSLTRADILTSVFDLNYEKESVYNPTNSPKYFMGVDQGNELQAVVAKDEGDGRLRIVHVEAVPFDEGFDRLAQLMVLYDVTLCIIDADPNRHSADSFRKQFPGKIYLADYAKSLEPYSVSSKGIENKENKLITNIAINRSMAIEDVLESVKEGVWAFPGRVDKIYPEYELVISHLLAVKKDIEIVRTPSGEKQEVVWRSLGPDHFTHSMLYLKIAAQIKRKRRYRAAAIGAYKREENDEDSDEDGAPKKRNVIRIRGRKS